ncbi:ATPase family AAA domain-containing protein 2 isoform X2 [Coccinella septempunctata]|nr:ATPase family AAA domain-containing protein 2 isoform X2 [Coccinella septempunctata]XP_044745979.1 ATPase family AAA domain-containing protein 2 isoform X2 [Coccinella septempunctata]
MQEDSDSSNDNFEDEMYSFRKKSRKLQRLSSNLNRIERRSALSLRPISRKSYVDTPIVYNSDEGRRIYPKRKRTVRFQNMSWLADDQMHKVGYPNFNSITYSEEDSRDVPENIDTREENMRTTRQTSINKCRVMKESKYEYDSDDSDNNEKQNNDSSVMESNSRNRKVLNDKDKLEVSNARCLRSQATHVKEEQQNEDTPPTKKNGEQISPILKVSEESRDNEEQKQKEGTNKDSTDSDLPLKLPQTNKPRPRRSSRNEQFQLTSRRTRKADSSSSDSTDEDKPQRRRKQPSQADNRPYSFRKRPPKPPPQQIRDDFSVSGNSRKINRKRHLKRTRRSSSSSSSSDSSDGSVKTYSKTPKGHSKNEQRMKRKGTAGGSNILPIGPETLDGTVRFNSIGGLDNHVQCLKEMILLPMMYPEVFQQFRVKPPRGVLFYGPPGTGKTLIARALANECSFGTRKVSFFLRKGADLLSKWIGESEKQLRILFEQAAEMKPSIIFFDELDGLVPVRSSRNDQIHASIVSTLLALMDGLDDRGEIIIIGATNRVDAIDPAFRRPGRFDRELYFPLPARREREEILKVHVSEWLKPPKTELVSYLADEAVGYCGSDLRALCTEAVIQSFRRTYPQVYNSEFKLLLQPEEVDVKKLDFMKAKSAIIPAAHRNNQSISRKLLPILDSLLGKYIKSIFDVLENVFPHGCHEELSRVRLSSNIRPAQVLLVGNGSEHGQTQHLGPALIYRMEHIQCYTLDLATLYRESTRSPEEVTIQIFTEAKRNLPSLIYLPSINKFWDLVSDATKAILLDEISQLGPNLPILFLCTAETSFDELPDNVKRLFSTYRNEVFEISTPSTDQRRAFFKPLIMEDSMKPVRISRQKSKTPPPLPKAPTPPPVPPSEEELKKLYDKEEHTLRELRIFLRDMCRKLANNKMFYIFTKPVDIEEVPDYPTIIKQPMDLETMMMKVDLHQYECAKDFLTDIELIVKNALEYNPAKTSVDKQIRHRACSLRDYAYTLIKTEMDSDFEDKCQDIAKSRKVRKVKVKYLPDYLDTPDFPVADLMNHLDDSKENGQEEETPSNNQKPVNSSIKISSSKKRKSSSWQRGYVRPRKRMKKEKLSPDNEEEEEKTKSSDDESKENNPNVDAVADDTSLEEPSKLPVNGICETPIKKHSPISETLTERYPIKRLSDLIAPSEILNDPIFSDADSTTVEGENSEERVIIDCSTEELEKVLDLIVTSTDGYTLQSLLDLFNQLSKIVQRYMKTHLRADLPKELEKELSRFKKEENVDMRDC